MARALLEGNALALRDVVEAIAAAGHCLTGLRVCRPHDVEATARGAAMLAAARAGLHVTLVDAARAMARPRADPVEPDSEVRGLYAAVRARHVALYAALRPLFY